MDFIVLKWNEKAQGAYIKQGAVNVSNRDKWDLWRLEGEALKTFASKAL